VGIWFFLQNHDTTSERHENLYSQTSSLQPVPMQLVPLPEEEDTLLAWKKKKKQKQKEEEEEEEDVEDD
jgi:hypothetical protein